MHTNNADHTAGWETRTARATTSSKQAAYLSLPCKHESSITTLLLLSPQSRPALRGPQDGRARNAPWAALAGCIMPPNLFGHTMSGLHVRQAAVAGVASSQDPFTSCESCQALSALFPIAGARAANTAEKKTIATIVTTTKGKNPNFRFL